MQIDFASSGSPDNKELSYTVETTTCPKDRHRNSKGWSRAQAHSILSRTSSSMMRLSVQGMSQPTALPFRIAPGKRRCGSTM